jgi:ABC-type Co2+ transport system permease subunit
VTGFIAGAGATALSLLLFLAAGLLAPPAFYTAIGAFVVAHGPIALIEGFVTASAVALLVRVKPEALYARAS